MSTPQESGVGDELHTPLQRVPAESLLHESKRAEMSAESLVVAREEVRRKLVREAWERVRDIEALHEHDCVRVVSSDAAAAAPPSPLPPLPPLPPPSSVDADARSLLRRPKLRNVQPTLPALPVLWRFLETDLGNKVEFIAAEDWEVARCNGAGASQRYRVHYYRDEHFFVWTSVLPLTPSGFFDIVRRKVQKWTE